MEEGAELLVVPFLGELLELLRLSLAFFDCQEAGLCIQ
jgi:hypothetical protein